MMERESERDSSHARVMAVILKSLNSDIEFLYIMYIQIPSWLKSIIWVSVFGIIWTPNDTDIVLLFWSETAVLVGLFVRVCVLYSTR